MQDVVDKRYQSRFLTKQRQQIGEPEQVIRRRNQHFQLYVDILHKCVDGIHYAIDHINNVAS